jgi:hypothetical protein
MQERPHSAKWHCVAAGRSLGWHPRRPPDGPNRQPCWCSAAAGLDAQHDSLAPPLPRAAWSEHEHNRHGDAESRSLGRLSLSLSSASSPKMARRAKPVLCPAKPP